MRKLIMFLTAMTFIAFTYMNTNVFAEGKEDPMITIQKDVGLFWINKDVKNTEGEKLGTVKDLVRDSQGKVSFAVVSHGGFLGFLGKKVAVPYSVLAYDREKQHYT
jgi:uncharacterized protein YrrD